MVILVLALIQPQVDLLLGCQIVVRQIHLLSRGIHVQLEQRCVHQDHLFLFEVIIDAATTGQQLMERA